jgi:hypothetical protein
MGHDYTELDIPAQWPALTRINVVLRADDLPKRTPSKVTFLVA